MATSSSCFSSASSTVRVSRDHRIDFSGLDRAVEVDGRDVTKHPFKSTVFGGEGPYVPFPSHSTFSYLGPQVWMLLLDCR